MTEKKYLKIFKKLSKSLSLKKYLKIFKKLSKSLSLFFSYVNFCKIFINSLLYTPSSLVAIRPHGSNYPVFFIPGAIGTIFYLYHLAHHLNQNQPFYGLQAKGIDGKTLPHKTVNQASAAYINEIKLIQPNGPYFLGGHSYGSYIAFEMAIQLQKQGEEVAFVGIVDSIAPLIENVVNTDTSDLEALKIFAAILGQWSGEKFEIPNILNEPQKDNILSDDDILSCLENWIKGVNPFLPLLGKDKMIGLFNVLKTSLRYRYKTDECFIGNITLFKAQDSNLDIDVENDLGWSKLTTIQTQVFCSPGDHVSIMAEPNVEELARKLQESISSLQKS
jgi:thioesterase domain-containing protein